MAHQARKECPVSWEAAANDSAAPVADVQEPGNHAGGQFGLRGDQRWPRPCPHRQDHDLRLEY